MAIAEDITPKVTEIRFENIGEEVVAKIAGSSMWFVYNVSIQGVKGNGKDLKVDVMSSSESEVQTRMQEANIVHEERVSVRVKTHFQNSKYLPPAEVPAKTTVCIFFVFYSCQRSIISLFILQDITENPILVFLHIT